MTTDIHALPGQINQKSISIDKIIINNIPTENKQQITHALADQFEDDFRSNELTDPTSQFHKEATNRYLNILNIPNTLLEETEALKTPENLIPIIKNLKTRKANGQDHIANFAIKNLTKINYSPAHNNIQ